MFNSNRFQQIKQLILSLLLGGSAGALTVFQFGLLYPLSLETISTGFLIGFLVFIGDTYTKIKPYFRGMIFGSMGSIPLGLSLLFWFNILLEGFWILFVFVVLTGGIVGGGIDMACMSLFQSINGKDSDI